jgi:aryl sulfotransferase
VDRIPSDTADKSSPDSSIRQDASLQEQYEVLCDIRDIIRGASTQILSVRLSAAGFDDIPGDALLLLYTIYMNGALARALMRRLGINGQAASQSVETLILRGYLEFRDNPTDPRQPTVVLTERGRAVIGETDAGLQADRWAQFPFRSGDIVISTVPKSGTTWMQMICALLIFQTPMLPASLPKLSPWLEAPATSRAKCYAELAAQQHRRFIKTHLTLNELPADPRVTYIVVARDPLDMAVSWHYHTHELLSGNNPGKPSGNERPAETARQWLLDGIDKMGTALPGRDSYFDRLLKSLSCAWERRTEPNVVLVHYEDLSADLPGEMRRLAGCFDITVPEDKWPSLIQAATFKQMQAAANQLQPMQNVPARNVSKEHTAFFRRGSSGEGRALLTGAEAGRYYARAAQVAPQDLLGWLHRDDERLGDPWAGAQA